MPLVVSSPRIRTSRIDIGLFALALSLAAAAGARLVGSSDDWLQQQIIVDDAFYYLKPAQNFVAGRGFSLDGENLSNGVQPLWALLTVVLAALIRDDAALARALVLLSAGLWMGGGALLFLALRRCAPGVAALAAAGWMLQGFVGRNAFQGMENGLHGFLLAALIWYARAGLRTRDDEVRVSRAAYLLGLGVLVALFSLARIDSLHLGVVLAPAIALGWLTPPCAARPRGIDWRGLGAFVAPLVVLIGGFALASQLYFGTIMPVSGQVKLAEARDLPPLHGSAVESLRWHAAHVLGMGLQTFTSQAAEWRSAALSALLDPERVARAAHIALSAAAVVAAALCGVRLVRARGRVRPWPLFVALLAAALVVRFAAISVLMQRQTGYCTWYFAPDLLVFWVLLAASLFLLPRALLAPLSYWRLDASTRDRIASRAPQLAAMLLLVLAFYPLLSRPVSDSYCRNPFAVGGQWVNQRLPAGQRIAAFSSGALAFAAPNQQVINFDGLINSVTFFRDYWLPGRRLEYLAERRIGYFADLASVADWAGGCFPGKERAELVRWWRYGGAAGSAYALWQMRPPGEAAEPVDPPSHGFCDRLSQLQFAAEGLGRYAVVSDAELQTALQRAPEPTRVLASIVCLPLQPGGLPTVRHILATDAQALSASLRPGDVDVAQPLCVTFGEAVCLLGVDVPAQRVRRGQPIPVTRFWRLAGAAPPANDLTFEMRLETAARTGGTCEPGSRDAARVLVTHQTRGCHDTYPVQRWQVGEAVVETYLLAVPSFAPPGNYSITLAVRAGEGAVLPAPCGRPAAEPGRVVIANVVIER